MDRFYPIHRPVRVFISSTKKDLEYHRAVVHESITAMGHFADDMAQFYARPGSAITESLASVNIDEVYIGIFAWRYGTIKSGETLSITNLEYQEAGRRGIPRLIFLASDDTEALYSPADQFPDKNRDHDHDIQRRAFRKQLETDHVVTYFENAQDLGRKAAISLSHLIGFGSLDLQIPHNLPPPVHSFVGREYELKQIVSDLRSGQHTAVAAAVVGMGGIGKSALASQVVHQLARDALAFSGGITWVSCNDLTGWEGLNIIYTQLLFDWGVTRPLTELGNAQTPKQETLRLAQVWQRRMALTGPALVLLDNVDPDLPLGLLLAMLTSQQVTALVTSRTFFMIPMLMVYRLEVLSPEEAQTLLRSRFSAKGGLWDDTCDNVNALSIVQMLGCLPLAIELAAARAARLNMNILRLSEEFRNSSALSKLNDIIDPALSVRYVLSQSLAVLTIREQICFASLGQVKANDYPQEVVLALFAELLGMSHAESARHIMELLITLSLLQPEEIEGVLRVRLHPLLQEIAAEIWRRNDANNQTVGLKRLLLALMLFIETHQHDFAILRRDEHLALETLRHFVPIEKMQTAIIYFSSILQEYLYLRGRWEAYREILDMQLTAYRELDDHLEESRVLQLLGNLANYQDRYEEATQYYKQSLALVHELGDQDGECEILNNIGSLASSQGHYEEAENYFRQSLTLARELGSRSREIRPLANLGNLFQKQGHYDIAVQYYKQSLALSRELGTRSSEGKSLFALGSLAISQGQYEEAEQYLVQSLSIEHMLGDRETEGRILATLGHAMDNQGQYEEAINYLRQSITLLELINNKSVSIIKQYLKALQEERNLPNSDEEGT